MFSKEETARLRKDFWVSYGKSFPRKWILYNTKIKDFSFKFTADRKTAEVSIDIAMKDEVQRQLLFEQIVALKTVLVDEYLSEAIFDENYVLENGKIIARVYVKYAGNFSIYNKETWSDCYDFFNHSMSQFELFWYECDDFIRQAIC